MTMPSLFPDSGDATTARASFAAVAAVALEDSLDKLLDYAVPKHLLANLRVGQRVRVPLGRGNRPTHAYVIAIKDHSDYPNLKSVLAIDDERVLLTPALMNLSRWMSRYYCTPLGTVMETMIPSAVKKKIGVGYTQVVRLAEDRSKIQELLESTKAPKRRAILARLLQIEPDGSEDLVKLASDAGATAATVRKLAKLGLISIVAEMDVDSLHVDIEPAAAEERDIELNEDQRKVFDDLLPRVSSGGFSVNLLQGVTGSGKTEIYLQCIREVVKQGRQAVVLVPEIALTPQTVRRFTARFHSVAILHSGLTATQRHRYWQQISQGRAQVVVGARSAIFAPLPKLGMIVVDEEHEASYKQDTAPRYHARDVAVKRAQMEAVPVLLGSATPSLETYWRVRREQSAAASAPSGEDGIKPATSLYHYLTLPRRVRGLSMPAVELIDMKQEARLRRGVHLLSQRLEHMLRVTLESGRQAILLLNRRGYSNFVYCVSCQNVVGCRYCDTTMTYHRSAASGAHSARLAESVHTGQLHCHYCLAIQPLPDKCPVCGKLLSLFGLGTQRVEEELTKKFPSLQFARVDSDTMRNSRDYESLLGRFAKGEIQVMLGTQMIAKGLDYPNVTLVGVISGDTALALPDFRAAERTFQLITQVAGRAGRGDNPGRVILQTFLPDDPTIQAALKQDFDGFAQKELKQRQEIALPPFGRMVRIIIRNQNVDKLHQQCEALAAELSEAIARLGGAVRMKGPMPCAISRIAGYHRQQVVLNADRAEPLQKLLADLRQSKHLSASDRIAVDVDPVSLL